MAWLYCLLIVVLMLPLGLVCALVLHMYRSAYRTIPVAISVLHAERTGGVPTIAASSRAQQRVTDAAAAQAAFDAHWA